MRMGARPLFPLLPVDAAVAGFSGSHYQQPIIVGEVGQFLAFGGVGCGLSNSFSLPPRRITFWSAV
jgi:hypothetical protein